MKQLKLKISFFFILTPILFANCQPINEQISTTDTVENVIYQHLLDNYTFNQKMKLKTQKVYNITGEKKELSQIIEYDKDGKIKHEERYEIDNSDTTITFLDYSYNKKKQVSEVIITNNYDDTETQNQIYQYDESGLLSQVIVNEIASKSTFYKTENGYESITMENVYDENVDSMVWKLDYTCHFDWNGNLIDFILNEENEETIHIEYSYNSKNKRIKEQKKFYGELTSIATFEYNPKGLLITEIIESFPYKDKFERSIRPSNKPEMRVYEYEFY